MSWPEEILNNVTSMVSPYGNRPPERRMMDYGTMNTRTRLCYMIVAGQLITLEVLSLVARRRARKADQQNTTSSRGTAPLADLEAELGYPGGQRVKFDTLSLELIRFLGILNIVFCHEGFFRDLQGNLEVMADCGHWWPSIFFMLSGYVLYHCNRTKTEIFFGQFVWRRLVVAYPSYFIATLLSFMGQSRPWECFKWYIYNKHKYHFGFTLMDTWSPHWGFPDRPDPNMPYTPNTPQWFICSMFFLWLGFPRWFPLIRHCSNPMTLLALAWVNLFLIPTFLPTDVFSKYSAWCSWPAFIMGMALARVAPTIAYAKCMSAVSRVASTLSCITILGIFLKWNPERSGMWYLYFHKGCFLTPLFAIIMIFLPTGRDFFMRHSIFTSRPLTYLGEVSSSLYIMHWVVKDLLVKYWRQPNLWVNVAIQLAWSIGYHELTKKYINRRATPKKITSGAGERTIEVELVKTAS